MKNKKVLVLGVILTVITIFQMLIIQIYRDSIVQRSLVYADNDTMEIVTGASAKEINQIQSESKGQNTKEQYEDSIQHKLLQAIRVLEIILGAQMLVMISYKALNQSNVQKLKDGDTGGNNKIKDT